MKIETGMRVWSNELGREMIVNEVVGDHFTLRFPDELPKREHWRPGDGGRWRDKRDVSRIPKSDEGKHLRAELARHESEAAALRQRIAELEKEGK